MGKKTARLGIFKDVDTTAQDSFIEYCKKRNINQFKDDKNGDFTVKIYCREDLIFSFLRDVAMKFNCTLQILYDDRAAGMDFAAAIVNK